jgi:hypothetical protein
MINMATPVEHRGKPVSSVTRESSNIQNPVDPIACRSTIMGMMPSEMSERVAGSEEVRGLPAGGVPHFLRRYGIASKLVVPVVAGVGVPGDGDGGAVGERRTRPRAISWLRWICSEYG